MQVLPGSITVTSSASVEVLLDKNRIYQIVNSAIADAAGTDATGTLMISTVDSFPSSSFYIDREGFWWLHYSKNPAMNLPGLDKIYLKSTSGSIKVLLFALPEDR